MDGKDLMKKSDNVNNMAHNMFDNNEVSGDTINFTSSRSYSNGIKSDVNLNDINKNSDKKPGKKKHLKRRIILGVVAAILGIIVGIICSVLWYKDYLLNKITYEDSAVYETFIDESGHVRNIAEFTHQTEHEIIQDDSVHNFLLIGIDSRSSNYSSTGKGGLADVIMVLSVNSETGTIKMLSIARDDYAFVPGYSRPMKINAAMSLAGPEVLKLTVENMLRLQIDGYAYVNFSNMAYVIDAVGGVYCNVSSGELGSEGGLNWNLAEINNLYGRPSDYNAVTSTGNIWLNGQQAVAYARIRKIDSDYKRSERQVEVLRSLLTQFMSLGVSGKAAAMDNILEHIVTNIPKDKITEYGLEFLPSIKDVKIEYMQLPISGCFNSGTYGGEWSIRPNWNAEIPYVQEFFYGETREFDPVDEIPNSPSLNECPKDLKIEDMLK